MRWMHAALLAAIVAAPAAQGYSLGSMEIHGTPLRPEVGDAQAVVEMTFTCQELRPYLAEGGLDVELSWAAAHSQFFFTGPKLVHVSTDPCIQQGMRGTVVETAEATVTATSEVPGELPWDVTLTAEPAASSMGDLPQHTTEGLVVVDYQGIVGAEAVSRSGQSFNISLHNLGNSASLVEAHVASAPDGVDVLLPDPVLLESPTRGPDGTSAHVTARVLGAAATDGAVVLEFVPVSTKDPAKEGTPTQVSLPVSGAGLPAVASDEVIPAPMLAPLVLAGLAALRRRT